MGLGRGAATAALGLAVCAARPATAHEGTASEGSARDPAARELTVLLNGWAGWRDAPLWSLDRALARDGFSPLPRMRLMGGGDVEIHIARVRTGLGFSTGSARSRHRGTGAEVEARLSEMALFGGYDIVRDRNFTAFATAGLGVILLRVDVGVPGFTLFRDQLDARALGTRLAWIHQLSAGSWSTNEETPRDLQGGPVLDASGARFRLVIGIGGYDREGLRL